MTRTTVLQGKVALVTGGGLGIGAAICMELAAAGATVAVVGRTFARCAALAARITALGGRALPICADVTVPPQAAAAVKATVATLGALDILINNAGVYHAGGYETTDDATWAAVWGTSVTGTFACTRAALPIMRAQGAGHVINIASQAAGWPGWNETAYGTAKAAQVKLTLHLLDEFHQWAAVAPGRWFAHVLCPGGVDTRIHEKVKDKTRLLKPADLAGLCREIITHPEWGLTEFEHRTAGESCRVGSLGLFERQEAVLRVWQAAG
jgi:NAD(P)-dependent dehydrogenase (short-subunit alcohol dehydrogenase family)